MQNGAGFATFIFVSFAYIPVMVHTHTHTVTTFLPGEKVPNYAKTTTRDF